MVISATVTPITPVRRFLSVTRKQFLAGPLIRIATSGFWASIGFARAIRKTNAIAERVMSFMVCVFRGLFWGGPFAGPVVGCHGCNLFSPLKARAIGQTSRPAWSALDRSAPAPTALQDNPAV